MLKDQKLLCRSKRRDMIGRKFVFFALECVCLSLFARVPTCAGFIKSHDDHLGSSVSLSIVTLVYLSISLRALELAELIVSIIWGEFGDVPERITSTTLLCFWMCLCSHYCCCYPLWCWCWCGDEQDTSKLTLAGRDFFVSQTKIDMGVDISDVQFYIVVRVLCALCFSISDV